MCLKNQHSDAALNQPSFALTCYLQVLFLWEGDVRGCSGSPALLSKVRSQRAFITSLFLAFLTRVLKLLKSTGLSSFWSEISTLSPFPASYPPGLVKPHLHGDQASPHPAPSLLHAVHASSVSHLLLLGHTLSCLVFSYFSRGHLLSQTKC